MLDHTRLNASVSGLKLCCHRLCSVDVVVVVYGVRDQRVTDVNNEYCDCKENICVVSLTTQFELIIWSLNIRPEHCLLFSTAHCQQRSQQILALELLSQFKNKRLQVRSFIFSLTNLRVALYSINDSSCLKVDGSKCLMNQIFYVVVNRKHRSKHLDLSSQVHALNVYKTTLITLWRKLWFLQWWERYYFLMRLYFQMVYFGCST